MCACKEAEQSSSARKKWLALIASFWRDQGSEPVNSRVIAEKVAIDVCIFFRECRRVLKQCGSSDQSLGFGNLSNHAGGVTCSYNIGWQVARDHRTSADNGVVANLNPFAYRDAIAQPYIVANENWTGNTDGLGSVDQIMPVGVAYITAGGEHRVVSDGDLAGGVNSYTGANQDVIAKTNMPLMVTKLPSAK